MATKPKPPRGEQTAAELAQALKDSAQQIWLAGVGAFAKAQEEGGRVFDSLVKEGTTLQRKTQSAAEERLSETGARMAGLATDLSAKAAGQWDKLENLFEARVAKALKKLDIPSAEDLDALGARIDELSRKIDKLGVGAPARGRPGAGTRATKPRVARKSP